MLPRTLTFLLVGVVLGSCTSTPGTDEIARRHGPIPWEEHSSESFAYTIELPAGWRLAAGSLTPNLRSPKEILSIGTYGLRPGGSCAQFPVNALTDLGPTDAFATIQERGSVQARDSRFFVPRPPHLRSLAVPGRDADHFEASECLDDPSKPISMWWIPFRDDDRSFYLLAALGPEASSTTVDTLWEILDRIRFT